MIAPPEADMEARALETLARIVVEEARAEAGRAEDRAANAARRLVQEAEDRIAELTRAAQDLGRSRGVAVDEAQGLAAVQEVEALEAGALDALCERFQRRVRMALEALPGEEARYGAAVGSWCREAAAAMDAPAEVFAAKRDRVLVYEALLAAGAEDFHVRVEHRVHSGFVVRDLDGRTLFDARPEAQLERHAQALRGLVERVVPEAPKLERPPRLSAQDAAPMDPLRQPDRGVSLREGGEAPSSSSSSSSASPRT